MPVPAASVFELTPAQIELSAETPSDTFNGQGDVAGVAYTPLASPGCSSPSGSIVVAGNAVAQRDAAGSPLIFTVFASGTAPPAQCSVTVSGSDGSSATVTVNDSNAPVTDVPLALRRVAASPATTPSTLTFTSLASVQEIAVAGFSGTTTPAVSCTSSGSGVQVTPAQLTGPGTYDVIPFGQGTISNSCSIAITDQTNHGVTVNANLTIGSLAKFTATPLTAQFGCSGTAAPLNCRTLTPIALSEAGSPAFAVVTPPTIKGSCANAFYGPLVMSGAPGTTTFAGLLANAALNCTAIVVTNNETPAQRVRIRISPTIAQAPAGIPGATPPPCTGPDSRVADAQAPHGMYVWNPYKVDGGKYESYIESDVIGKDPDLCGVSLLVSWSDLEKTKGVYTWDSIATQAAPYVKAGLTVNLLIADASEVGSNTATPAWVTDSVAAGGAGVATISCSGQPPYPDFLDPTYEADYEDLIRNVVAKYGNDPTIGYIRFGIGAGVEAYPAHFSNYPTDDCSLAWKAHDYSFSAWVTHTRHIVNYMGSLGSPKQLMIALNYIAGWTTTLYDYPNAAAEDAANHGLGFGTENLGIGHVADPGTTPAACNPQATNASIYWCQAFMRHAGAVPFEFQPIEAVSAPVSTYTIDFANLLQYALDNNTQLFEIYPQDWLEADSPTPPIASAADQAEWKAAFQSTALIVGAHVSGSTASNTPITSSAPGASTLASAKNPLGGLIDMQDIAWHNTDGGQPTFDISNAQKFPGILGGIVINATWSQMQPIAGSAVDFSATDAALAQINTYNAANAAAPLGVKLRIYGGSNAPQWAKNLAGGPITIYRNPAGCNGQTDTCALTVGPFWTAQYIADWRKFQAAVAAKYDANPTIAAVAVTSCAAQTDEPFVASSGPVSRANLSAAGYTDTAEQSCLSNATADYAAWATTDIDFTFNAYTKLKGGVDAAFTQSVMTTCRAQAGPRCVLDNHALQTPLTSDLAIYADIAAMGGLINFQTQSPESMGCIWPETITQGLFLGARAIEIWPEAKFQGFDTLTTAQMQQLSSLFTQPVPESTPVPRPLPTPCSGFN